MHLNDAAAASAGDVELADAAAADGSGGNTNEVAAPKPWKATTDAYAAHFRELLSHEHLAEKEQVMNRVKKGRRLLEGDGV